MDLKQELSIMAKRAKDSSVSLANMESAKKKAIIMAMAEGIRDNKDKILAANSIDLKSSKERNRAASIIDRLTLNDKRIEDMALGLQQVAKEHDPIGRIEDISVRPNGLIIKKMTVPIGLIGIIYEARPNVTADCAGICVKSGNAIILRGGSEAINSNTAIFEAINNTGKKHGLPEYAINFVKYTDREAVDILLGMAGVIDLVIPRGGESLIKEVVEKAKVPVIKHAKGVCHVYVDKFADIAMADNIVINAKVQRPGVCNAMETLLVHKDIANDFLPGMIKKLLEKNVEIRGCEATRSIVKGVKAAVEDDWYAEYLDLILAVKVVDSLEDAIYHIRKYGSAHSDSIVTKNESNGARFVKEVDSACVYINASTRFTDGAEFGKGAEIGISTDKIHARGPMGVEELTTYKYVIFGNGQIRQ